MGFIKIKNFCLQKDIFKRMIRQTTDWENVFPNIIYDNGLDPEYMKNSLKTNNEETNSSI